MEDRAAVAVSQRGCWSAVKKGWKGAVIMRASWLLDSVTTYQQSVDMASRRMNYWWLKPVDPWDHAACCPQSAGGRTVRPNPLPRIDSTPLKVALQEQADVYLGRWIYSYNGGLSRTLPSLQEIKDAFEDHKLTDEQMREMCVI